MIHEICCGPFSIGQPARPRVTTYSLPGHPPEHYGNSSLITIFSLSFEGLVVLGLTQRAFNSVVSVETYYFTMNCVLSSRQNIKESIVVERTKLDRENT